MHMRMFIVMRVYVAVVLHVLMSVKVGMRPVPDGTPDAPKHINKPECDQHPGRDLSAERFHVDEGIYRDAQGDPQHSQQH